MKCSVYLWRWWCATKLRGTHEGSDGHSGGSTWRGWQHWWLMLFQEMATQHVQQHPVLVIKWTTEVLLYMRHLPWRRADISWGQEQEQIWLVDITVPELCSGSTRLSYFPCFGVEQRSCHGKQSGLTLVVYFLTSILLLLKDLRTI